MKKIALFFYCIIVAQIAYAQASGGQIRRPKTTRSEQTPKTNTRQTSPTKKSGSSNSEDELERKYKDMSMISLEKYANQGDAMAQFFYGYGYAQRGEYGTAVYWYRKAANQGLIRAQLWLAFCYYNGKGVKKDVIGAREWLKEAASRGSADAKEYLRTWH